MVAIIGAGISGLSTAFFLEKKNIPYILIEASERVGGLISSTKINEYLIETGPNSILCDQELIDFLKSIGLEKDFIYPSLNSDFRYIYKNGKYRKLPNNPISLITSTFFSWKTKFTVIKELFKPKKDIENETLSHFFKRRFNQEIVDYALNPFVSGIYAGDPEKLILDKTFPILKQYENIFGSILKGFIKSKTGKRKISLNFKNGMEQLPISISQHIKNIKLKTIVSDIVKTENNKYIIKNNNDDIIADKIVFCTSSQITSSILYKSFNKESEIISKIEYPPMFAVYTAFNKKDINFKLDGFGGLNPKIENQYCAGSIWTSSIMPNRCPKDQALFTSFIGGAQNIENTKFSDEEIKLKVRTELKRQYNINSEPRFQYIKKWPNSLPQYTEILNSVYKVCDILEKENIYINSNWKEGVSIGDCIKKGEKIANKLII